MQLTLAHIETKSKIRYVFIFDVAGGYSDCDFDKMKVVAGLELLQPTAVGVFHHEQTADGDCIHQSKCIVLSNHGTRVCPPLA